MKILGNFSLRKFIYNKKFSMIFSLVMACLVWMIITIEQKPNMERTFTNIPVNINLEGTTAAENKMNLITDIAKQKFTVAVRGPGYIVGGLTADDFSLFASAMEVKSPGEYSLTVSANMDSNAEYEILSINPPTVTIQFDYIDTKEFPLAASAEGAEVVGQDLLVVADVVGGVDTDKITIEGPRTEIEKIKNVVAVAKVNKVMTQTETFDAGIVIYGEDGNIINSKNLKISTNNVKVEVSISKQKTVPVKYNFSNVPVGFSTDSLSVTIDNPKVKIIGAPEKVDEITAISLTDIDLSTLSVSSSEFDVLPKLPDGITIAGNIQTFKVSVNLRGCTEKTVEVTTIKYTGLGKGLTTTGLTSIENVKICGPSYLINRFKTSNIYAEVDLSDKKAGAHTVTVKFKIEGYTGIWVVGSYKTNVTIK